MDQRRLDAQCIRWRHHKRHIEHCENPECPAKHPEGWTHLAQLEQLEAQLPGSPPARSRER